MFPVSFVKSVPGLYHGWRFPFLLGGFICIISFYIRKNLHETLIFKKISNKPRFPIIYLFSQHLKLFLVGTGIVAFMSGLVVVTIVFMPTYLHEMVGMDNDTVSTGMLTLMIINTCTVYYSGKLAQKYNPLVFFKIILIGNLILIPLGYLLFYYSYILLGLFLLGLTQGFSAMIVPYVLTNLFPPSIRLTGVASCYNFGFTLFGGLAPFFLTNFIKMGFDIYLTPALYLIAMIIICGYSLKYIFQMN